MPGSKSHLLSFILICAIPVWAHAQPARRPAASPVKQPAASETEKKGGGGLKQLMGGGGKGEQIPVYIKSDTLALDTKDRVFTYKGNVDIVRGDIKITADAVIGRYDEKNQLQTVIAENNVVLTRGEELRASANRAVYSIPKATIELTEAPELSRKGNVLSADKITIYVDEDRSEAEGNVRVKVIQPESGNPLGSLKEKDEGAGKR